MGYHLHLMIYHGFEEVRNDFVVMFLHHFVTIFLYGFSYLTNMVLGGAVVMFLHDIADVPIALTKCFYETTLESVKMFLAAWLAISWFYTRILVFP
jgi:ceramide synthetase